MMGCTTCSHHEDYAVTHKRTRGGNHTIPRDLLPAELIDSTDHSTGNMFLLLGKHGYEDAPVVTKHFVNDCLHLQKMVVTKSFLL